MTCVFNAERLKIDDKTQMPYIVYEAETTRSERNFKRLWVVVIILISLRKIADKAYMNLRQGFGSAFCFAKIKKCEKNIKKVLTNRRLCAIIYYINKQKGDNLQSKQRFERKKNNESKNGYSFYYRKADDFCDNSKCGGDVIFATGVFSIRRTRIFCHRWRSPRSIDYHGSCRLGVEHLDERVVSGYAETIRKGEENMREILFRAKRLTDQKWTYGDFTEVVGDCPRILSNEDVTMYAVDPSTIGQYTGLKDKNGKKIFEGDIVWFGEEKERGVVYFDNSGARFAVRFDTFDAAFDHMYGNDLEIVGSIHDNHEPLKGDE